MPEREGSEDQDGISGSEYNTEHENRKRRFACKTDCFVSSGRKYQHDDGAASGQGNEAQ